MLQINPLGDHAGAEAVGIDLREPLDEKTRRRLNDALVEHVALVVRNQTLTAGEFVRGLRVFGEPMKQNFTDYRHKDEELVNLVSNTFPAKSGERVYYSNYWHTDHTNHEEPPKYTALYAVELPRSGGGDTGIVNMRAAYERLPVSLRDRIAGLRTVNVFQGSASRKKSARYGVSRRAIDDTPVIHPLVRTAMRSRSETGSRS